MERLVCKGRLALARTNTKRTRNRRQNSDNKINDILKSLFFHDFLKKLKVKHSFIIGKVKERGIKKGKGEQGEAPRPLTTNIP